METRMQAKLYCWDELEGDNPIRLLHRKRISGEKMMLAMVTLDKGCRVETHRHDNEQFACVMSGRAMFGIGEKGSPDFREVEVKAGEVLHLPSNVHHSVDAPEETHILDLLSPPGAMGVDSQKG
jgi:quercetin dioxygenase-like cupin family protein